METTPTLSTPETPAGPQEINLPAGCYFEALRLSSERGGLAAEDLNSLEDSDLNSEQREALIEELQASGHLSKEADNEGRFSRIEAPSHRRVEADSQNVGRVATSGLRGRVSKYSNLLATQTHEFVHHNDMAHMIRGIRQRNSLSPEEQEQTRQTEQRQAALEERRSRAAQEREWQANRKWKVTYEMSGDADEAPRPLSQAELLEEDRRVQRKLGLTSTTDKEEVGHIDPEKQRQVIRAFFENANAQSMQVAELAINKGYISISDVLGRQRRMRPEEAVQLLLLLETRGIIRQTPTAAQWESIISPEDFNAILHEWYNEKTVDQTPEEPLEQPKDVATTEPSDAEDASEPLVEQEKPVGPDASMPEENTTDKETSKSQTGLSNDVLTQVQTYMRHKVSESLEFYTAEKRQKTGDASAELTPEEHARIAKETEQHSLEQALKVVFDIDDRDPRSESVVMEGTDALRHDLEVLHGEQMQRAKNLYVQAEKKAGTIVKNDSSKRSMGAKWHEARDVTWEEVLQEIPEEERPAYLEHFYEFKRLDYEKRQERRKSISTLPERRGGSSGKKPSRKGSPGKHSETASERAVRENAERTALDM